MYLHYTHTTIFAPYIFWLFVLRNQHCGRSINIYNIFSAVLKFSLVLLFCVLSLLMVVLLALFVLSPIETFSSSDWMICANRIYIFIGSVRLVTCENGFQRTHTRNVRVVYTIFTFIHIVSIHAYMHTILYNFIHCKEKPKIWKLCVLCICIVTI